MASSSTAASCGEGEDRALAFEYISAEPKPKKGWDVDDEEDESVEEEGGSALVEASPRKALPGPRKDRPKLGGAVPSVPRRKDD